MVISMTFASIYGMNPGTHTTGNAFARICSFMAATRIMYDIGTLPLQETSTFGAFTLDALSLAISLGALCYFTPNESTLIIPDTNQTA